MPVTTTSSCNPAGGRDFLSIQAAFDDWALTQDGTDSLIINCYYTGTTDTTAVDISGITTTGSITVQPGDAASRCDLREDKGYLVSATSDDGINANEANTTIDGLRITNSGSDEGIIVRKDNCVIKNCMVFDTAGHGIQIANNSITAYVYNNFVNRSGNTGIGISNHTGVTLYAYNNLVLNSVVNGSIVYCGMGFANLAAWDHTGSVIYAKNNIVAETNGVANGDYWEGENGIFHSSSTKNYASDTSASTYLPALLGNTDSTTVNSSTSQTGTRHCIQDEDEPNVGTANGQYLALVDQTSTTQDDGEDLSADGGLAFSDDALGNSRPSGSWDVGPHQLTAGGSALTVNDTAQAFTVDTPTLSSLTTLSIDDQAYNFSVDNLSLADVGTIIAQEVAFAFSTDVVNLTSDDSLSLQALEFNFTVDQLTLTAEFPLVVNDVSWGFTVEAPTLVSSVLGTVTIPALTNNAGSVEASQSSILYWVYDSTFTTLIASGTDATTDGSGNLVINNAAITAATDYWVFYFENLLDTGKRGSRLITAT